MQKNQKTKAPKRNWLSVLKHNWFNIIIVGLILYIFVQKDVSLQLNMNNAPNDNQAVPKIQKVVPANKDSQTKEAFTERTPKKEATIFEKFKMPSIGKRSKKIDPAYELSQIDEKIKQAYLKRFAQVAINEQKKFGIPASITLSNALLHSFAGKRSMAIKGNNQFGIQCGESWDGELIDIKGNCYRAYGNAWLSFRNHSQYLASGKFKSLNRVDPNDYKAWAKALEKDGFSDFDNLAKHLIKIINTYGLNELDTV